MMRRGRPGADRGSGTVIGIGLVGVLSTLLVAGLLVASVAAAGQRARTAADLAALAVVGQVVSGDTPESGCALGAEIAAAHGTALGACQVVDREGLPAAEVEVTRQVPSTSWVVRARASAGAVPRVP